MLTPLGHWAARVAARGAPLTSAYGLVRTLLALSTALTLLCNESSTLFTPVAGVPYDPPLCHGGRVLSAFCTLPVTHLDTMRWGAALLLFVVASGWRPRVTGLLHAWLAWSLQASATLVEGGDQIASNLALLLLPATLCDARRWHWSPPVEPAPKAGATERFVAWASLAAAQAQVAFVYFHAAAGKFASDEWADGTAVYYWFTHPFFGAADWLRPTLTAWLARGWFVAALTWGTIALEFALAASLLTSARTRRVLLPLGLSLHAGILVVHGLVSFALVMTAALWLLLADLRVPLPSPPRAFAAMRGLAARLRRRASPTELAPSTTVTAP
jgi:antimicrobial peptide system SdpB family protein